MIMVKGKGKGRKFSITNDADVASGEEEKIPVQKKRGRPLKLRKEEINDEEFEKAEEKEQETENTIDGVLNKVMKSTTITENGRKRKAKGKSETIEIENGIETRSRSEEMTKSNGFRHIGSRRKSKPCRAAEAGVECQLYFG